MEPWSREPVGRFDELEIESAVLRDNPLGDPHVRPLWVYVPPAYDAEPDRSFPSIYLIQGMTGQLDMWQNRTAFRPSTPERIDRLFAEEDCPPALVVAVDAWTSYGGSQFIDSPGTGRYGEYLCDEVWQRWLAWDPVRMARRHADALRSLRAIYIDAGKRDEYYLDLGADAFRRELEGLGITDVFFELFDAKHGGIEYRYPLAIRYLAERLQ